MEKTSEPILSKEVRVLLDYILASEIIFITDRQKNFELVSVNGETIAGIALVLLSLLFLYAGTVNDTWAIIIPADFLIFAIGCAFIALGVITLRRKRFSLGY
jgi:hypothetical protein